MSQRSLTLASRLAQVAFTVTQFPLAQRVVFRLEGRSTWLLGGEVEVADRPVTRDDYESLLPAIFVESPTLGDQVASPIRLWGTADVFEARFHVQLLAADGTVLAEQAVQATSGTGTRGSFDATLTFTGTPGEGSLVVYSDSPRDGSRINEVRTPVRITAGAPAAMPSPPDVVLSPTPQQPPATTGAEWQRNLRANHQAFDLHRAVALVDMETGRVVAQVGPDTITVDYETSVGGRAYWMTVLKALRDAIRRREVYLDGASRWRNPEDDLPADFELNRDVHYSALRQPLDSTAFIAEMQRRHRAALTRLNDALTTGAAGG